MSQLVLLTLLIMSSVGSKMASSIAGTLSMMNGCREEISAYVDLIQATPESSTYSNLVDDGRHDIQYLCISRRRYVSIVVSENSIEQGYERIMD